MISIIRSGKFTFLLAFLVLIGGPVSGGWDTIDDVEDYDPSMKSVRFTIWLAPPRNQVKWLNIKRKEPGVRYRDSSGDEGSDAYFYDYPGRDDELPDCDLSSKDIQKFQITTRNFFAAHQIVSYVDPKDCFPFAALPKDVKFLVATFLSPDEVRDFAQTSKANWVVTQFLYERILIREKIRQQDELEEENKLDRLLRLTKDDLMSSIVSTDCSRIIEFLFLFEGNCLEDREKFNLFSEMIYDCEREYKKKVIAQKQNLFLSFEGILKCAAILKAKLALPTKECIQELVDLHLNRGVSVFAIMCSFNDKVCWRKEERTAPILGASFFSILKTLTDDYPDYFMTEALKRIDSENLEQELAELSHRIRNNVEAMKAIDCMINAERWPAWFGKEFVYTAPDFLEAFELTGPEGAMRLRIAKQINLINFRVTPEIFHKNLGALSSRLHELDEKSREFFFQESQKRKIGWLFDFRINDIISYIDFIKLASEHISRQVPLELIFKIFQAVEDVYNVKNVLSYITSENYELACKYELIDEGSSGDKILDIFKVLSSIEQKDSVLQVAQKYRLLSEDRDPKTLRPILEVILEDESASEAALSVIEEEGMFTPAMSAVDKSGLIRTIARHLNNDGKRSEVVDVIRFLRSRFSSPLSCHLFTMFLSFGGDREKIYNLATPLPQGDKGLVFGAIHTLRKDAEVIIAFAQNYNLINQTMTEEEVAALLLGLRSLQGDRQKICKQIIQLTRFSERPRAFQHVLDSVIQLGSSANEIISLTQDYNFGYETMTSEEIADLLMGLWALEGNRKEVCELSKPFISYCTNQSEIVNLLTTIDDLGREAKDIIALVQDKNLLNENMSGQDIRHLLVGLDFIQGDRKALCDEMKPLLRDTLQGDEIISILVAGCMLGEQPEYVIELALDLNLITEDHYQKVRRHPGLPLMKTLYLREMIDILFALEGYSREALIAVKEGVLGEDIGDWSSILSGVSAFADLQECCKASQSILREEMGSNDRIRILQAVSDLGIWRDEICEHATFLVQDGMNHEDVEHILQAIVELEDQASEVIEQVQKSGLLQDHMNGYGRKQILRVVMELGSELEQVLAATAHLRNPGMSGREVAHILRDFVQN